MTISSMTGFASTSGSVHGVSFIWEMRSVNGKGLDARLRLPNGFEALEQKLKRSCGDVFKRGNIQISLSVSEEKKSAQISVNQDALDQILKIVADLSQYDGIKKASIDGVLNVRGVLEETKIERDEASEKDIHDAVESSFENCLILLKQARDEEGLSIAKVLKAQVSEIGTRVDGLVSDPSRTTVSIKERLKKQVEALIDANSKFDDERLYAEAALLATKADLQEEIDRLQTHVDAANQLLDQGGPVGRRLDFLAQEFNRETNTVCSKSNASSVTNIGLELKVLIDQFREQIQNVE